MLTHLMGESTLLVGSQVQGFLPVSAQESLRLECLSLVLKEKLFSILSQPHPLLHFMAQSQTLSVQKGPK